MSEPWKTKGKLRITKKWEKSRILTVLSDNKGRLISEREITLALARFMIEESSRPKQMATDFVTAVKYPTDSLNELEQDGLIREIEKQDSGKSVFYYSIK